MDKKQILRVLEKLGDDSPLWAKVSLLVEEEAKGFVSSLSSEQALQLMLGMPGVEKPKKVPWTKAEVLTARGDIQLMLAQATAPMSISEIADACKLDPTLASAAMKKIENIMVYGKKRGARYAASITACDCTTEVQTETNGGNEK